MVKKDAKAWLPFLTHVLEFLFKKNPHIQLVLFGQVANEVNKIPFLKPVPKLYAEHPYNLSFIQNPEVISFFKPLHLLKSP